MSGVRLVGPSLAVLGPDPAEEVLATLSGAPDDDVVTVVGQVPQDWPTALGAIVAVVAPDGPCGSRSPAPVVGPCPRRTRWPPCCRCRSRRRRTGRRAARERAVRADGLVLVRGGLSPSHGAERPPAPGSVAGVRTRRTHPGHARPRPARAADPGRAVDHPRRRARATPRRPGARHLCGGGPGTGRRRRAGRTGAGRAGRRGPDRRRGRAIARPPLRGPDGPGRQDGRVPRGGG